MRTLRIGSGAGFADDRIDPARLLAEQGRLDYLGFECLAERTIALAQRDFRSNSQGGYNEWLDDRMYAVLPACVANGVKVVTNMGVANPLGAAKRTVEIAKELGLGGLRVAAVTGDDVLQEVISRDLPFTDRAGTVSDLGDRVISANAYIGAEGIVEALGGGAQVVITGRVSDPTLFLAPLIYEFGWDPTDWPLIGKGIAVGHLLECVAQVSGGFFADPGYKEVPDLLHVGFPIAEVQEDGAFIITKVPGTGGLVTPATCTEQLLYEIHDPSNYFSSDGIADFSAITLDQVADDTVAVSGASGRERPSTLKVSVGYTDGCIGIGEISYAGPNARRRGELAAEILRERLRTEIPTATDVRVDLIGLNALFRIGGSENSNRPKYEFASRAPPRRWQTHRQSVERCRVWAERSDGGGRRDPTGLGEPRDRLGAPAA